MKKIFYLLCLALVVLAGCKKTDFESTFEKSPEERMADAIALVSNTLTSAPNGWIATLPTSAGGGYGFYMNFDANQKVTMYSDISDAGAANGAVSTYRVTTGSGAMLAFDTYNFISMLQDPKSSVLGGVQGSGFSSDVEFTYVRSTPDSLIMVGRQFRQPLLMVKATAAQKAAFLAGDYKTAIDKFKSFFSAIKYPYIEIVSGNATLKAGIAVNVTNNMTAGKRVSFTGVLEDNKTVVGGNSKFAFKLAGADLLGSGLVYNGIKFVKFAWKDDTTLAVYDSTGKEYIVKSSPTPLTPLYLLIGAGYTLVTVPNATTYAGWGADYVTRRATAASAMLNGGYALRLEQMAYTFNNTTKKLTLTVNMPQNATLYVGTINYTYTRTDDGIFKFNYVDADGNGAIIVPFMVTLLGQRLNVDNFTVDYLTDPVTGGLFAQFKSVQNPTFTFSGVLQ
ncbi:protein of unknown function [Pedobacter suwonensis]|uniref:DUF4302 domain-containing protein n=1 Tax=Pedobacter suwonensis TaxID=332999 RepID=A0A1I0U0L1_9SPHI|nr:DUF4302 domain-containing protein [Pedobacter suwonensis]SFA57518.1 protein of unknown function [Pedobacter suwonensis]